LAPCKRYCADGSPKDRNDKTDYWYRCNPDGEVTRLFEDRFGIPNTFIWTEDVRLIIAASVRNEIKSYGLNPAVNWLSDRRIIQYCHATASVEGGVA
jgi:sugar lactone lactonase YvrE